MTTISAFLLHQLTQTSARGYFYRVYVLISLYVREKAWERAEWYPGYARHRHICESGQLIKPL